MGSGKSQGVKAKNPTETSRSIEPDGSLHVAPSEGMARLFDAVPWAEKQKGLGFRV